MNTIQNYGMTNYQMGFQGNTKNIKKASGALLALGTSSSSSCSKELIAPENENIKELLNKAKQILQSYKKINDYDGVKRITEEIAILEKRLSQLN